MSVIQIYYTCPDRVIKNLVKYGVDLDISVRMGNKTLNELYNEIKHEPNFCREESSISYIHFLSIIRNNAALYADLDGKVAGALSFEFNIKNGEKVIMFEGICSPKIYSGQGVGQELINTLIRIGKINNFKYIFLKCKGDIMKYYRDKFGFEIIEQSKYYDSDDEDDDFYYDMRLELSKISGGKIKKRKSNKRRNKKVSSTRKRRKLRKF
jgi:GNAT superfamily N-acetyltransferase